MVGPPVALEMGGGPKRAGNKGRGGGGRRAGTRTRPGRYPVGGAERLVRPGTGRVPGASPSDIFPQEPAKPHNRGDESPFLQVCVSRVLGSSLVFSRSAFDELCRRNPEAYRRPCLAAACRFSLRVLAGTPVLCPRGRLLGLAGTSLSQRHFAQHRQSLDGVRRALRGIEDRPVRIHEPRGPQMAGALCQHRARPAGRAGRGSRPAAGPGQGGGAGLSAGGQAGYRLPRRRGPAGRTTPRSFAAISRPSPAGPGCCSNSWSNARARPASSMYGGRPSGRARSSP